MIKNKLDKIKGYVGIAKRAKYVVFGADNLKGYTHKLYLVLYREDVSNTIQKVLNELSSRNLPIIKLSIEEFNYIADTNNCKLLAIKNKGLSEQIINNIRSEF
ncbi:MAG: hypothetical protein E7376_00505 [Clostridiales bacterium]|nr:hypothetical protein [Clostridiales bacterium]